jgi:hypothetical protein
MPSWLLTSAYPIWIDDRVVGAIVLEEDTAARLALGQATLERLTLLAALAVVVSVLALLAVASITVGRVVRLRNEAEAAIDAHGRVVGAIRPSAFADEIGDLRSSHARVLARLGEHQDYLVKLRGRLGSASCAPPSWSSALRSRTCRRRPTRSGARPTLRGCRRARPGWSAS